MKAKQRIARLRLRILTMVGILLLAVVLPIVLNTWGPTKGYSSFADCLAANLETQEIYAVIDGKCSKVVAYADDFAMTPERRFVFSKGKWHLANRSDYQTKKIYMSNICFIVAARMKSGDDLYITIGEWDGMDESWAVYDNIGSKYQKVQYLGSDGMVRNRYITCIPADTGNYELRLNKIIIKDIALWTDWPDNSAYLQREDSGHEPLLVEP